MGKYQKKSASDIELEKLTQSALAKREANKRKQVEVKAGGKTYVIKKWKHLDTLDRMPNYAELIYVPMMSMVMEEEHSGEGSPAGMIHMMCNRLQDLDMREFILESLDNTTLKGKDGKLDIDEDFESPVDIITVLEAVFSANFMTDLCAAMFSLGPQAAGVKMLMDGMEKQEEQQQ